MAEPPACPTCGMYYFHGLDAKQTLYYICRNEKCSDYEKKVPREVIE